MRALVVGAGIGGLGAAVALRQHGVDVDVVEVKPDFSVYGVGINQPANSLRALRSLGVLDDCLAVGYQFDDINFYDQSGTHVVSVPYAMGGADVPANNALSRLDLHRILVAAAEAADLKIAYSTTVDSFTDDGQAVQVSLSDGRQESYDLVAAFDGIHSGIRRRVFPAAAAPVYSGFGVFRITLPRPADVIGMRVYQALGVKIGFCPLSPETMYMFVVTPDPEDVVHRPEDVVATLSSRMSPFSGLPGDVREALDSPDGIVWSPISDVLLPLPWFSGRVGILGDAAHACAPHLTQGAGMALEDGVVLAETLSEDGPLLERLRRFEARRYPRVKLVQDVSRAILQSEMAITAQTWDAALEGMRAHLVGQMRRVDQLLDAAA